MRIHGLEANVLLDSGCTSNSVSPEFTMAANLKVHELEEPMPLQLGMVGSHSKINFGLFADFELDKLKDNHYFDVINIDRYDAIVGTVFMQKYGIVLDFKWDKVRLQGLSDLNEALFTICDELESKSRAQGPLERKDIPRLRKEWLTTCNDILQGVPERPPPMREINHQIPLVDESKQYHYHLPCCPDSMRQPLAEKIDQYCRAGWWCPAQAEQAAPMLVIPKKNSAIRTVVNAKK
ncbi:hypothetical protein L208DRAFT_1182919, partial [Tricholoma matsutake]